MAYTIQRGDTLSQLAQKHGTTVAELIKLNPQIKDPNKIYAGESLALPQATTTPDTTVATSQTGGDMTLPSIGDTLPGLPIMDMTNVQDEDVLAMALKNIAQLAQREGKVTGLAATSQFFADRGILPEDLPGSSVANMLAVVDRAMTAPVAERAGTIADLFEVTRQRSEQQLNMLINTGGIMQLDDSNLYKLANMSNMNPEYLVAIREQLRAESLQPDHYMTVERADGTYHIGIKNGKIVTEAKVSSLTSDSGRIVDTRELLAQYTGELVSLGIPDNIAKTIIENLESGMDIDQVKRRATYALQNENTTVEMLRNMYDVIDSIAQKPMGIRVSDQVTSYVLENILGGGTLIGEIPISQIKSVLRNEPALVGKISESALDEYIEAAYLEGIEKKLLAGAQTELRAGVSKKKIKRNIEDNMFSILVDAGIITEKDNIPHQYQVILDQLIESLFGKE